MVPVHTKRSFAKAVAMSLVRSANNISLSSLPWGISLIIRCVAWTASPVRNKAILRKSQINIHSLEYRGARRFT